MRSGIRDAAKKLYKERTKNVPKKKRIAFADFFKQYKKHVEAERRKKADKKEDDFDFGDMIV